MQKNHLNRAVIDSYVASLGPEIVRELIQVYREDATIRRDTLASLRKNLPQLGQEAHAIKGASANLGLVEVADIAKQLQHACDQNDYKEAMTLAKSLEAALDEGLLDLDKIFKEI